MFTKEMTTLSKRHAHERLESLSIRAHKALWFRKQYGLQLDTLCIKDTEGNQYPLKISPSRSTCLSSKYPNYLSSFSATEDGDQDAPLYNGYLFQRGREQERNPQPQPQPAYPPYTYYLTGNPRIPLQYVPQAATQSHSLFNRNSVTHSSVLSHYCWHYQPTDILKSSQRHLEIFLPSVIKSSVV